MHQPASLSLRRQLLLWLLLQLVLWAGGGVLAYRIALSYAEKAIDQSLTQSVRALARQVKPIGSGLLVDFPRAAQDVLEQDPKDKLSYMVSSPPGSFLLGNQQLPQPGAEPSPPGEPVLYRALVDGKPQRIVALDLGYGEADAPQTLRVQVGKSLAVQQQIARELVADMLAPLLALGLLLSLLVYGGVRRGLAPLTRLTAQLEHRSVNALSPIGMTQAPSEVHALVRLSRKYPIMKVVQECRSETSKWLKRQPTVPNDFAWQAGYGAFSVSESLVGKVTAYIRSQEEHHKQTSFQDEFRELCRRHNLDLDERYAWD